MIAIAKDSKVQIYINRSHIVRSNGKGYSRMFLTIGRGAMLTTSKKLGLIITSLTKTEVVVDGECFPKYS